MTFYTDWLNERMTSLSLGEVLIEEPPQDDGKTFHDFCEHDYFGGTLVERMHPIPKLTKDYPTSPSGNNIWFRGMTTFTNPSHESSVVENFIKSEFYVEYHSFTAAMAALWENRALFLEQVAFTEFRTLEQDEVPLSPAKNYQMVSMNFRWINDLERASEAVKEVQRILTPFEYRVNWGSFWHTEPEFGLFKSFEDDLDQLKQAIEAYPNNKFRNCWVDRVLFGVEDCTYDSQATKD